METTIEKSKIDIIQWVASIEDENILNMINEIRNEIDSAWANESEKRLKAVENGEMNTISLEDVYSTLNI